MYIWPWNIWMRYLTLKYLKEIFELEIVKKLPKLRFFGHFLDFASLVYFDFTLNDRWVWCLVVFFQFTSPVNVFLLLLLLFINKTLFMPLKLIQLFFCTWYRQGSFFIRSIYKGYLAHILASTLKSFPLKNFLYFFLNKLDLKKFLIVSGNGNFLHFRKGIFRTLAYLELETYSES